MFSRHSPVIMLLLAAALTLPGCQPEEKITHAVRPNVNNMYRLLGVLVLPEKGQQKTWAFKVVGRETEIKPLLEPYQRFLKSIQFDAAGDPTWTLANGME